MISMKKIYTLIFFAITFLNYSQTYNMPAGVNTFTTCTGNFYDSGGPGLTGPARAGNNESRTITFCPVTPGDRMRVVFTVFSLENNADFLDVYDGTSTAAPLLASLTGAT